jgi:hypothetical protein
MSFEVMDLDGLLRQLREEQEDCEARAMACDEQAAEHRHAGELLGARMQGIEEARRMIADPAASGNGAAKRPRRDIRALVKEVLGNITPQEANADTVAKEIGCRPSQVRQVLASLATP